MPLGNTQPIVKLASKQISLNTNDNQDFVTLEDDLSCIITGFVLKRLSGPIVSATISFGWNALADDVLPLTLYDSILDDGKDSLPIPVSTPIVAGKIGNTFAAKVSGVLQDTTLIVDVWGYAE